MSVVVTGATGHLGRLVVTELLARGVPAADVVATGRRVEAIADLAAQGVRVVASDYADPESLRAAFEGAGAVLLVSGNEVGQRVTQHGNAIEAAKAAGVGHLVYTSAPRATTSDLVLAPEHKATEELLAASGLTTTVLRNNWYTENYVATLEQARATGELVASAGDGRVASATRADFAAAAAAVLTTPGHGGKVYELGGDTAWTHHELAAAIGEVLGREVVYRPVSPEEHLAVLTTAGLDEGTAGFVVALDGNIRDGALADVTGDLSRLTGRPTTPLVDGLRAAVEPTR
ncbi:SDR family oxidoreductase [Cellulomonas cellasea]|uniref:NAD(P)-dependent oxidoreductase n=1 Tax=Cellulomonas cellasea TaxID=43670 RepID=A0A4Y3KWE3_9CELL|nr:SDR family oxidoreductase [Cellulomonas cellasea]GEA87565.1 NAD(P)-dependent oxidoreductase [Cellulomonas cellasea]